MFNPLILDDAGIQISQGKVKISVQALPLEEAKKKENGLGRDPPNNFPPLPEPTGRMKFDITNPL